MSFNILGALINVGVLLALLSVYAIVAGFFGLSITTLPPYFDGLLNYMIPALLAFQAIPIIGTFVEILIVWATFEFAYFAIRTILRLLEWANITGKPILD